MKKIFNRLRGKAVLIFLGIALILTGVLSGNTIKGLQGNARVINYTGIVRGATQRLIKKELNHVPDDGLIARLDGILEGLAKGSSEFDLICLECPEYQELLTEMQGEWTEIKKEILNFRNGRAGDLLFSLSEDYFELADRTVLAAEVFTEKSVQNTKYALIYVNGICILLAVCSALSAFWQDKRRRKLDEAEQENKRKSEHLSKMFQQVLTPMNEISELMYISDIDTYELLFINNAGRETFQCDEREGVKCYELIQGRDEPCPFCTSPLLKTDENYTWEYTNPITKRHYLLKDRLVEWEGRPARMEIAFDITETANEKIELQKRVDMDKIMVDCIRELYRNHNFSEAAFYVLEQAGKLFMADRAYIIVFHGEYFSNTSEWCREGIEPQKENLQNIPKAEYEAWFELFQNRENLIIEDVDSLKETMSEGYEILEKQGIRSVVLVPLERGGEVSGCIGLDNPPAGFMDNGVSFLEAIRYFLMLAMKRNEDEQELYRLSYQDTLTSFYNRNRYMIDTEELAVRNIPAGVVYLDLNGLKEINDMYGHDAGDLALKECARTIQKAVKTGMFYRIGGDEFVIICTGIEEDEFNRYVCELKDSFRDEKCRAAIGSKWTEKSNNIRSVIAEADKMMYSDKEAYYQDHGPTGRYRHYSH